MCGEDSIGGGEMGLKPWLFIDISIAVGHYIGLSEEQVSKKELNVIRFGGKN